MGVMIFFVLSGFLITSLLLYEHEHTGAVSLRLFYARRALRLLPALVIVIGAACVVALTRRGTALSHETLHFAPAALFYFGNWLRAASPNFVGGTLAHTWSLSVEEQFYIGWAVLLALLLAAHARLRTVAAVALTGAVLSDIAKLILWSGGTIAVDANRMYGTDMSADGLMLGCALAVAVMTRPKTTLKVARVAMWPAAVFLFVVIAFVHPLAGTFGEARTFDAIIWPLCNIAAAAVIGYLVLSPSSRTARLLGSRPMRYVGQISYGLYLWHYPILIWLLLWFGFHNTWWQVPIEIGLALAAAAASHHFIERPALKLKDRLKSKRGGEPEQPESSSARLLTPSAHRLIELRGASKRYRKLEDDAMLLRSILPWTRPRREEMWALRDLELTVNSGEILGVIGHNGAGKTTLLRLLAGVTSPTTGRVRVTGRIAPLISLGVGFHDEMSGRENAMVNGMLLGLTAQEVAERFDSIVDFAELGDFIDTPVKFYSSGMVLRLGFAVVVHVEPTILLVDEILAVGDAGFQLKCFDRLREFQQQGAAILMVSHALHQIRQMCDRSILIRHGQIEFDGATEEAIALHETLADSAPGSMVEGGPAVEILDRWLAGANDEDHHVAYDQQVELHMRLRFNRTIEDPQLVIGVLGAGGQFGGFNVTEPGQQWRTFSEGEECVVRIEFAARLGGGSYELASEIRERDGGRVLARFTGPRLTVASRPGVNGIVDLAATVTSERL